MFSHFLDKYRQFGGHRLVLAYMRMGLTIPATRCLFRALRGKVPLGDVASEMSSYVVPKLRDEFKPFLAEYLKNVQETEEVANDGPIWWCWLQGMDNAPELVKRCYESLIKYAGDKKVVVLDLNNIHDYVEFPELIERKYRKGIIPHVHYADLLRIALLYKYGGTWIDSTCMITGDISKYIDQNLFLFQILRKGVEGYQGISSWWVSARKGHPAMKIMNDMLIKYWERYDCVVEYFFFHLFYGMIMRERPDWWLQMPKYRNRYPLLLGLMVKYNKPFDDQWLDELKKRTSVHKLNWRLDPQLYRL